jgi:hypothetical protein
MEVGDVIQCVAGLLVGDDGGRCGGISVADTVVHGSKVREAIMNAEHRRAMGAVRAAVNEVVANYGDSAGFYVRDACDFYLSEADVAYVLEFELATRLELDGADADVVAMLEDGTKIRCDLNTQTITLDVKS